MKRVRRARPVRRAGIVLCGGRSSRMGRAKAWLPWFGRTMIEHVVESLRPAVDEVIVVTSASLDLPALDVRVVVDREEGRGPLAGIREGLAAANAERAFVTSTDVPFLTTRYVERLFAHAGAVAPVAEERVQVLSAVYPCAAWSQADALLERGIARPLALLESVGYTPLDGPVSSEAPAWRGFNTPGEYLDCARAVDPAASAELELLGRAALGSDRRVRSVPIGTLSELLADAPPELKILEGDRVAPAFLVSLGGRDLVRNALVPIGPGERVSVIDGLAGG
jgi:molybdopterin-guanine dinucleotide biosynthesis protein A